MRSGPESTGHVSVVSLLIEVVRRSVVLSKSGKSRQTFVGWPGGLCGLAGESVNRIDDQFFSLKADHDGAPMFKRTTTKRVRKIEEVGSV